MTNSSSSTPKKDVLYVDIEDDITSIIGKVKSASASIVALVPPKRIGVLQSTVNLKLLQRAAENSKKRIVMITNDPALTALAAGVGMPIAKNLQSKPEIPEVAALNIDDDEVINGEELPLALHTGASMEPNTPPKTKEDIPVVATASAQKTPKKSSTKIPNFDKFRNKMGFIIGGAVLLIAFLIWAIFFAPHATVTITARTTSYDVNKTLSGRSSGTLDAAKGTLPVVVKEIQKTASADFTATGKKEVGEKATGTVRFSTDSLSTINSGRGSIPAGTTLTSSSGAKYTTNSAVTLTLGSPSGSTAITAADRGASYNGATGSVSGAPSGIDATITAATSGGTDKTITVVSEQDAASAKDKIPTGDANSAKAELKKQFGGDVIVIDESYVMSPGAPAVTPAVGSEASSGKVTIETKYTMIAVARSDAKAVVENDLKKQIAGLPNQKIYENGVDKIRFANVTNQDGTYSIQLQTTGYVGPYIDSNALAKQIAGKREGEIQAQVKTYEGIESVDVKFSPFWVSTAPGADKTTIKFQVKDAN